jgi:hypothetical protein
MTGTWAIVRGRLAHLHILASTLHILGYIIGTPARGLPSAARGQAPLGAFPRRRAARGQAPLGAFPRRCAARGRLRRRGGEPARAFVD